MRADSVGHDGQRIAACRQFCNCTFRDGFDNDRVHREGKVIAMLFRVTNGDQDHFARVRNRAVIE